MTDRELLPQSAAVPDSDYVIIGGTGDLSLRKIFPALFLRYAAGQVTDDFRFFVLGRQTITAELQSQIKTALFGWHGNVKMVRCCWIALLV